MPTPHDIANDYIALWNELDGSARLAILARSWSARATFADPIMRGQGQAEIDALIAGVHSKFPGFVFTLTGSADGHGNAVRFSWALGPKGGEALVEGTDFVTLDGDRIASVTGFLDRIPAAA